MIILDTNVVSEAMRPAPNPRVLDWLDDRDPAEIRIPAVVIGELHYGLEKMAEGHRREGLRIALERLANEVWEGSVIPFDEAAARFYGWLMARRDREGRPMGVPDCRIAAIALANDASLATRDGGFEGCGIEIINPWLLP